MTKISTAKPRDTVQVAFDKQIYYEAPTGTSLKEFCDKWQQDNNIPAEERAIAAIVDNKLRELTVPVTRDITIRPVTLGDSDGNRIYRRTLSFMLVVAIHELFGCQVVIDHAMPSGAFFCHLRGRDNLTAVELQQLKQRMLEMVEQDLPITRSNIPLEEARSIFAARNDDDKLRLLQVREQDYLSIYNLKGYVDYFFGYMAPSTGYIHWFNLMTYGNGFALRYPRRENPGQLLPPIESPKLSRVFQQTGEWLNLMGLEDIGQLNQVIAENRIREVVLVAEALHERQISQIGERIARRFQEGVRIVLIAGPTSAGKTTTSKRLAIQLMTHGLKPFTLELDNYFVNRELTPLDELGEYDFEALHAVDIERLNRDLLSLVAGTKTVLPRFDFVTGQSSDGSRIQLTDDTIIILEGIHGMNPGLTPEIPVEQAYRVYVSALTQLNIDRHNRVPTTDVRLIRRIIRDATYRNYTAEDTLARWSSVRRGEKRHIFPFQEYADAMFNSSMPYELAALRPFVEPLLLRVSADSKLHVEAHRLLSFLRWVRPMESEVIPDNSLLREFIGGSILRDYHPGG